MFAKSILSFNFVRIPLQLNLFRNNCVLSAIQSDNLDNNSINSKYIKKKFTLNLIFAKLLVIFSHLLASDRLIDRIISSLIIIINKTLAEVLSIEMDLTLRNLLLVTSNKSFNYSFDRISPLNRRLRTKGIKRYDSSDYCFGLRRLSYLFLLVSLPRHCSSLAGKSYDIYFVLKNN